MKKSIYISLVAFLCLTSLTFGLQKYSQEGLENYKTETFSFEKGIAHQTVYSIYKDSKGFIWFGTMYGLVHYMGSNTSIYRHDPKDKNTLSNDDVTNILEDSKGNFWISTFGGGFNKFDIKNNKITRFTPSSMDLLDDWNGITWDIKEDSSGNLFIATDNLGIIKLDPVSEEYSIYSESSDGAKLQREKKLFIDSRSNVYAIIPNQGLYKFEYENNSFVRYSFPNLGHREIQAIIEGKNNDLFIGSEGKVFHYYFETNKSENLADLIPELKNLQSINTLYLDSRNNIWVGSYDVIAAIDLSTKSAVAFSAASESDRKILPGPVVNIVEDNTGIIWAGSYLGGITKISNKQNLFTAVSYKEESGSESINERVNDIFSIDNYRLLVAATDGLSLYNSLTKSFTKLEKDFSVYSIKSDKSGNVWLGTNVGIKKLDDNFKIAKSYMASVTDTNSLSSNLVISITFDNYGNLWAATANGLNKIELKNDKIMRYIDDPNIKNDFSGRLVLSVYIDKKGYIWAGTYSGLNQFDPRTNSFKLFKHDYNDTTTISNNYVFSYCEDSNGNFWIGTGNGPNKYDYNSETFELLPQSDKLNNGVIFGILEVGNNLLLSTADGISVYDYNINSITNYRADHGLNSNMFSARSYTKTSTGDVVFGGPSGFTIINSSGLLKEYDSSPVYVTSISSIEGKLSDNPAYAGIAKVEFPYNTSYVKFEFSSLDFSFPDATDYKYMLVGFDSTWVDSHNKPFAMYSKIPPGNYNFYVKAGNSNEEIASINVIVTPPFWETWWFYFSIGLLFVLTGYLVYRNQLRLELNRAKEIERIRNEEETKLRKKAADDFHDELGHRITKISLYSELLRRTISDQESGSMNYLHKISNISTNLASGVKDFIWTLDPGKDTLYDVAIRLKDFGDDLFDKSGISFRTDGINQEFENTEMEMDWRRHTILIFKEAMNNILKYSNAKNVLLSFNIDKDEIDISLNDDGDGFDIETIIMGRGLKNIRMRAASVRGKIDIHSSKGEGTSIRLHSSIK